MQSVPITVGARSWRLFLTSPPSYWLSSSASASAAASAAASATLCCCAATTAVGSVHAGAKYPLLPPPLHQRSLLLGQWLAYQDFIMGAVASNPNRKPVHMQSGTYAKGGINIIWASCGVQGVRMSMEDAHITTGFLSGGCRNGLFAGVFDGHGGGMTSAAVVGATPGGISRLDQRLEKYLPHLREDKATIHAMYQAFTHFDGDWFDTVRRGMGDQSGTTAVTVAVHDGKLACMNIGDSRAVCSDIASVDSLKGRWTALSEDHKPTNPEEHNRIQRAGSSVLRGRVQGDLALSRAFGDFAYKDQEWNVPSLDERIDRCKVQAVTCVPEVQFFDWARIDILVLACDGVWDVMNNSQALSLVQYLVRTCPQGSTPHETLEKAVHMFICGAIDLRSMDNVSATIILKMPTPGGAPGDAQKLTYRWLETAGARKSEEFYERYVGENNTPELSEEREHFVEGGIGAYSDLEEPRVQPPQMFAPLGMGMGRVP